MVSSISKQSKNDASILLAEGGDMFVSSLVTKPQLQDVRDIATGKSKAYVFTTQEELNDWMAIQDNVAKLVIGDNLYIVDKEVTDNRQDGTDLKELETELPDMSNVMKTLGTATGSGNTITDIQIDGKTLTPAKNTTFVATGFGQSFTRRKTFTNTIISNGIQYSGYDNNSEFLADGGVRSIADIQSASYTKSDDDTLLLLKADKTQLIDSYTKTETNNLLNNKIDNGASKTDTGVSYTKIEDDSLLFAKADKTQLIDSYSKTETNNLLNDKANQSTTYTKTGTDQLISQIDTGNVDLSSFYTKTKTDELLNEKANTTDLSNYMTLGTAQTINANKTFNNSCRFVSSNDGMSTVTGSSFIKSGADDTVVLLGAGGTKPISEFADVPTDLSNYYTKTQTYSQTEANNKFVRLECLIQQTITGRLKYVCTFEYQDETQDLVVKTYLTMSEVDAKLTNVVTTNTTQSITGAKTFNANVRASRFVKAGKDNTSVLLTDGGDRSLSSFGGIEDLISTAFSNMNGGVIQYIQDDIAVATYIPFPSHTVDKGGYVIITHANGLINCKSTSDTYIQCASAIWVK
ncbi:MAG: hypothetical protein EZS28_017274 [Streblomastix strix]|uniref:Uncharacterized protein n=1 Tax=Streblomastix strix TaxID=222440 RepID=A0A5J4VXB4_9EUKA|nr:MAG: hypothetical protein EZS28_017274 [Streblomastix strix]